MIWYPFGYTFLRHVCAFYSFFLAHVLGANNTVTVTVHALFMNSSRNIWIFSTSVGLVHCSWNPQISLFRNVFIKNGPHVTIHIFKNCFVIEFSIFSFSKISSIQTDPWSYVVVVGGCKREAEMEGHGGSRLSFVVL